MNLSMNSMSHYVSLSNLLIIYSIYLYTSNHLNILSYNYSIRSITQAPMYLIYPLTII